MKTAQTLLYSVIIFFSFSCAKKIILTPNSISKSNSNALQEESYMNIPVSVSYSYINNQISQFLSDTLYHDDSFENNDGDNIKATVTLKSPAKISGKGQEILIQVPLHIKGEIISMFLNQAFDCDVFLKLATTVEITPNWKIKSKTQLKDVNVVGAPQIKVGFFQIDSKALLEKLARSYAKDILNDFDTEVYKSAELKDEMQRMYTQLQQAIKITDSSYLYLHITEVLGSSITSTKENFSLHFGFKGKVFLEQDLKTIPEKPLIPFLKEENLANNYKIVIIQKTDTLDWQKNFNLEFQKKNYQESRRNFFSIDSTLFYTNEKQLVLEHFISGNVSGKLQSNLTLSYDSIKNNFNIRFIDFTASTLEELNSKAAWILKSNLKSDLETYFNETGNIEAHFLQLDLRNVIEKELQDPHLKVEQKSNQATKTDFSLDENQLHFQEKYTGEIQIYVK